MKFLIDNWDKILSAVIAIGSALSGLWLALKSGKFNKAKECMEEAIKSAEELLGVAGATKKEIVLSKVRNFCNDIKLKFNESLWSKLIDECVKLMNSNARLPKTAESRTTTKDKAE